MARRFAHMSESYRPDVHIPVDVIVEGEEYLIKAFVPGVTAEDVKIEILENVVSISGEFTSDADEDTSYMLREVPSGDFSRKLRLPKLLDASGAEAEVKDGILNLRVPLAEEAKAKQIKVKVK
jgi:HSP20 family protein